MHVRPPATKLCPMVRRVLLLAAAVLGASAAPAAAQLVDVVAVLGGPLSRMEGKATVPVLLPDALDLDDETKLYGSGGVTKKGYELSIAATRRCGANVCGFAFFSAQRGGRFAYPTKVKLRGGVPARFKGLTCGASCSPAAIQFKQHGVLYEISAKLGRPSDAALRTALAQAANEALKAGDRLG